MFVDYFHITMIFAGPKPQVGGVIENVGGSVGAVVLLLVGIFGIIWSQTLSRSAASKADGYGVADAETTLLDSKDSAVNGAGQRKPRKALGFVYAVRCMAPSSSPAGNTLDH